jgi:glycosyltransferase involved in cell wall biosynthesis
MSASRNETPLVSIITPVYNGERYLVECIESVLAQTYTNWDYVLLNNCSSDKTLDIAKEYAAKHARIRVHTNDSFEPVIRNHNVALRLASPQCQYIKVVFADDWLFPECIERMVSLAEANPSVGLVGAYGLRGRKVVWDGIPLGVAVVPGRKLLRYRLLGGEYVFGSPSSLLMRAELVRAREAFYNEANFHADTEACFEVLRDRDFGFIHQVLIFAREQEDSLTSYSIRMNTYLSGALYDLLTYGPQLLSEAELATRLHEILDNYYAFLARSVLRARGKEFWRYHKQRLAELGRPLSEARLLLRVGALLIDHLLNPKRSLETILANVRVRRSTAPTDWDLSEAGGGYGDADSQSEET